MRDRERHDKGAATTASSGAAAAGGGQGDTSSAGDVASESSLPDIQVRKEI